MKCKVCNVDHSKELCCEGCCLGLDLHLLRSENEELKQALKEMLLKLGHK